MIVHFVHNKLEPTTVGSQSTNEIELGGVGISAQHAVVTNQNNKMIELKLLTGSVTVNGKEIETSTELLHNDRVSFGSGHLYAFHHPQDAYQREKAGENLSVSAPTFNEAQKEIAKEKGFDMETAGKSSEDLQLMDDLVEIIPMVNEVNAISVELDKKAFFEIILISPQARGESLSKRTLVFVKFMDLVDQTEFYWIKDKFVDKKFVMQEMYQNYQFNPEDVSNWDLAKDNDPFYEDPETTPVVVGGLQLFLESLAYLVDMDDTLQISDYRGQSAGHCEVVLYPVDPTGKAIKEAYIENPNELLNKPLNFEVMIKNIKGLHKRFKNLAIEYKFEGEEYQSPRSKDKHTNFSLNYHNRFSWESVSREQLDLLQTGGIFTQVCCNQRPNDKGLVNRKKMHTKNLINDMKGLRMVWKMFFQKTTVEHLFFNIFLPFLISIRTLKH